MAIAFLAYHRSADIASRQRNRNHRISYRTSRCNRLIVTALRNFTKWYAPREAILSRNSNSDANTYAEEKRSPCNHWNKACLNDVACNVHATLLQYSPRAHFPPQGCSVASKQSCDMLLGVALCDQRLDPIHGNRWSILRML